jgi:hypothetical protein
LSLGLALGACSSTTDRAVVHPQEKTMTSSVSAEAPRLGAPEVLRRLLALIDSVHQPQDLTIERVARFSGFAMQPSSGRPPNAAYAISQPLTENWWYRYVWRPNNATRLPGVGLAFYETENFAGVSPPMTDICQLDAEQFHNALLKSGYRHVGNTRRASASKQYQRGLVEVEIGMFGESGESLEKISHRCIHRVSVGFLVEYMDLGQTR